MNAIKSLFYSISVIFIIQFVFQILAPERFRSVVKSAMSLITVAVIALGIVGIDLKSITDDISLQRYDADYTNSYVLVLSELDLKLSEYLESLLEGIDVLPEKVSVTTTIDQDNCISINEASILLDRKYEKDESAIRSLISKEMGDFEVIVSFAEV